MSYQNNSEYLAEIEYEQSETEMEGVNKTGHYNFVIVDREIVIVVHPDGFNIPSCLNLSLEAIGLYVVLKAHAIAKNFVFPSITTLEKLARKSRPFIIKLLRELEEKGLISIKKRKKGTRQRGVDRNIYHILQIDKVGIASKSVQEFSQK